jgi:hypothetical protein
VHSARAQKERRVNVFGDEISDVSEFAAGGDDLVSLHLLAGDPLDCSIFEFTKWEPIESTPEETEKL